MNEQWHHDWFRSERRNTRSVRVGTTSMGGSQPLRVQSMLTSRTADTATCIEQTLALVAAGCEIVRLAVPTVRDATHLVAIRAGVGNVPLVADIHFKPEAAFEAALHVDKVRINPGNYADRKMTTPHDYDDEAYATELEQVRTKFAPLVLLCQQRGVAMRIGVNHGSLSDRILNRYGDTIEGMVESAIEFAHIARESDYHEIVFSMKSSNAKVMIAAYRLLVARLDALGWDYPIHLGVTEAGDGEDGRIKSAIGIGSLLADGIGDTLRVSLTEESVEEIPVACALARIAPSLAWHSAPPPVGDTTTFLPNPFSYVRRASEAVGAVGGSNPVRIFVAQGQCEEIGFAADEGNLADALALDPCDDTAIATINALPTPQLITVSDNIALPVIGAFRLLAARVQPRHPILLKDSLSPETDTVKLTNDENRLATAVVLGSLLCDGIGDAVCVRRVADRPIETAYNILQASGVRIYKTEYIACPSCGRTLFDLQETTARVKAATAHLVGVKIAIMGCIVNGPGEMADADFGYVGGAPSKINLYVGKTPVALHIPQAEAVEHLIALIRKHGRWEERATL